MKLLWDRRALGGVLAGLGLFLGTEQALRAQEPKYIPPVVGQPVVPASYQPQPVSVQPDQPQGSAQNPIPFQPLGAPPVQPAAPAPAQPSTPPPGGVANPPIYYQPQTTPPAPLPPAQPVTPGIPLGQPMPPAGFPADPGQPPPLGMPPGVNPGPGPMGLPAPVADDKPKFSLDWANGLFFKTADGKFSFHAGGAVQYDVAFYSGSTFFQTGPGGVGRFNDGANLRRGRLFFEGTLYQAVDYKFELEFFNGIGFSPATTTGPVTAGSVTNSPGPTDAWITIKDVPILGNVRIGSQKEWFSLEHLNVYRYLEFLERSYLFDFAQATAFNNGFTPGISTFRTWLNDRVFTAIGVYKNESDLLGFGLNDGNYAVTGRVAALPIWMPEDKLFWHVGGAMSHRDPVNGQVQIRIRDNIRNAPFPLLNLIANTGLINAHSQDLFNLETAAVWGPLTFQAEYTANVLNNASVPGGPPQGDLFFQGAYVEAMLFLTGESRTWNVKNAFFNRVQPLRPLRFKPSDGDGIGFGAWEIAARYSYIDLANKAVQAGRLDSATLGLNWYLNSNAKMQFNYDYTQRLETPNRGHIHAFGTRMAYDF